MQGFVEGRSLFDLGVDGWVILQWMRTNRRGDRGLDCSGSGMETGGGLL